MYHHSLYALHALIVLSNIPVVILYNYEEYCLLGCSTVWVWFELTFLRSVGQTSATYQKTIFFIVIAVKTLNLTYCTTISFRTFI
jgi:hypothetical protein